MRAYAFDIREALLKSGKSEFLKHGFEHASMRTICKNAGVTTGAFYAYFNKKEELFSSIVDPVIEKFYETCQTILHLQKKEHYTNGDSELHSIEFMIRHREEFRLLFDCSAGTKYENFQEEVLNGFMLKSYQTHLDFYIGKKVDPNLVNILLRMKFEEYRQLLYGSYSLEEARMIVKNLTSFTEAGFIQLMKDLQTAEN